MGNLLDNALRAVEADEVLNKEIRITLTKEKGFIYLEIKNTFVKDGKVTAGKVWKEVLIDKMVEHGFGILNVRTLIGKYNGKYAAIQEDPYYITRILLPCNISIKEKNTEFGIGVEEHSLEIQK